MSKIPATIVTGFLGAGKTTLITRLLTQANGKRIALIVNEFGDVGIDGSLLAACGVEGCSEDDIIELANGCLCCTVADDFLPAMEKLLDRANPPEHIVIETSGLALPKPLVKAFEWPGIKSRVTVDGVVVVVDGPAASEGRFESTPEERARPGHDNPLEEVFSDQLACADLVLLNKSDLMEGAAQAHLETDLRARLRPGVKMIATHQHQLDARVLLGLEAAAEDDLDARPTLHDNGENHDHDDFDSFAVAIPASADPAQLAARVRRAIEAHDILRIKGFVAVTGKEMRHVIQAAGPRVTGYYDRPWRAGEARDGRLVVIGLKGLDQAAISAALAG